MSTVLQRVLFDASRMGQRGNRGAASPSGTPGGASSGGGRTPTAHPERGSSHLSYEARAAAAAAGTPATSVLSTSSFSPPQPLVLLAVRPLGRVSELDGGRLRMLLVFGTICNVCMQ